jgi:hypothetical protein
MRLTPRNWRWFVSEDDLLAARALLSATPQKPTYWEEARDAVRRTLEHADEVARDERWIIGEERWVDEAKCFLWVERDRISIDAYEFARELLAEEVDKREREVAAYRALKGAANA